MKHFIASLALSLVCSVAHAQWLYFQKKIGVDEVTNKYATVKSRNSLNLDFPYNGINWGILQIQSTAKAFSIGIGVERGQLVCNPSCLVKIKFDNKPSRTIKMAFNTDLGKTNFIYVSYRSELRKLTTELSTAKKLALEMPIYGAINKVVEFDVSGLDFKKVGVSLIGGEQNPLPKPQLQNHISQDEEKRNKSRILKRLVCRETGALNHIEMLERALCE
jgi:hypothetical protein